MADVLYKSAEEKYEYVLELLEKSENTESDGNVQLRRYLEQVKRLVGERFQGKIRDWKIWESYKNPFESSQMSHIGLKSAVNGWIGISTYFSVKIGSFWTLDWNYLGCYVTTKQLSIVFWTTELYNSKCLSVKVSYLIFIHMYRNKQTWYYF